MRQGFVFLVVTFITLSSLVYADEIVSWGFLRFDNADFRDSQFIAIAAGEGHNLALKADGSIVTWGINGDGQAASQEARQCRHPAKEVAGHIRHDQSRNDLLPPVRLLPCRMPANELLRGDAGARYRLVRLVAGRQKGSYRQVNAVLLQQQYG